MKCYYHTRHIPKEHLKLSDPTGKVVENNGLCDVLDEPIVSKMQKYKIDIIETRVTWREIEEKEGVLDFTALRNRVEKIKNNGFGVGIFPWFQHVPEWVSGVVRLKCLEHGEEHTLISLWDPKMLQIYDRLYKGLADEFKNEIDFLYVGVYGDFGEVFYPHGVTHYIFSSPHGHPGMYCGDELARADWKNYIINKYKTVEKLNEAWKSSINSFDENLMCFEMSDNIIKRFDFSSWYSGALMNFTEEVCKIVRKYFPNVRAALPIGQRREPIEFGQIKSLVAKIAGKYNMSVRWTSVADFKEKFAYSNICSRRLSSAAKFYNAGYGVEAALFLGEETAGPAIYEMISNRSGIFHNDPGNIIRGGDIYDKCREFDDVIDYITDTAIFYPIETELSSRVTNEAYQSAFKGDYDDADRFRGKCEDLINMPEFYDKLAELRGYIDYEICDSLMIKDGFLKNMKKLVIMSECKIPLETARWIDEFVKNGGKVFFIGENPPEVLETEELFSCAKAEYSDFGKFNGRYYTKHEDFISEFNPATNEIRFMVV